MRSKAMLPVLGFSTYRLIILAFKILLLLISNRRSTMERFAILAGICAVLGHNFTCWLKFKGGKGIATSAGVYFALAPLAAGISLGTWIIVFALGRYVSVASIAAAVALPTAVWLTNKQPVLGNRHHSAGTARYLQTQGQHPALAQWHRAACGQKPATPEATK